MMRSHPDRVITDHLTPHPAHKQDVDCLYFLLPKIELLQRGVFSVFVPPLICHPYLGMWDKFYINGVTTYFKEGITHHIHTSTEL